MLERSFAARTLAALLFAQVVGCSDICEYAPRVCGEIGGDGAGGGTGGDGGGGPGGAGGDGGQGGMPAPDCFPIEGEPIGTGCGVFVAFENEGNGTQADPFGSITEAVAGIGQASRIYVCGDDTFTGSVTLPPGISIYGSLDCDDWTYATTNSTPLLVGTENVPAVTITGVGDTTLQALRITAPNATGLIGATQQGNSSIALWVSGTNMTLEDVTIVAGNGVAGDDGVDETDQANGSQLNPGDFTGNFGLGCGMAPGGEKSFACPSGTTAGSAGGPGGVAMGGGASFSGSPLYGASEPNGSPGSGDTGGGWSCGANGGTGETGADGPLAMPGPGGSELGILIGQGYLGAAGAPGEDGEPGQGGGGGGGRRSAGACLPGAGPSGGSGGAGGCGGVAGAGGGAGGGSIGIVSLGATWTFAAVSISVADGGAGGAGGDNQTGGIGGNGGNGGNGGGLGACNGGGGGTGAAGGSGGGGRGGPSIGIAYTEDAPNLGEGAISVAPTASSGGAGGNGNAASNGAAGARETKQPFD